MGKKVKISCKVNAEEAGIDRKRDKVCKHAGQFEYLERKMTTFSMFFLVRAPFLFLLLFFGEF